MYLKPSCQCRKSGPIASVLCRYDRALALLFCKDSCRTGAWGVLFVLVPAAQGV
jgi:hypothetical protein